MATAAETDPAALRARFRALTAQKEDLESCIEAAAARLNAPGGPGLTAPLVDREGFPRADVGDLPAARRDRHALARWTNDHKALMREVEGVVHALMAAAPGAVAGGGGGGGGGSGGGRKEEGEGEATAAEGAEGAAPSPATAAAAAATAAAASGPALPPFASVGDVAPCSPAAAAGMEIGDLVLRLAGVDALGGGAEAAANAPPPPPPPLERIAAALAASEGRAVACLVLRAGRRVALELTPRRWAGRGLLGCNLRPLALPAQPPGAAGGAGAGAR